MQGSYLLPQTMFFGDKSVLGVEIQVSKFTFVGGIFFYTVSDLFFPKFYSAKSISKKPKVVLVTSSCAFKPLYHEKNQYLKVPKEAPDSGGPSDILVFLLGRL